MTATCELQRAARAAYEARTAHGAPKLSRWARWDELPPEAQEREVAVFAAGLRALREPSDRVNTAGFFAAPFNKVVDGAPYQRCDTASTVWKAMVDAVIGSDT
jgi:hypothetical protein